MLRIDDFTGLVGDYRSRLPRAALDVAGAAAAVQPIVEDVAARGEAAIREYTYRFDEIEPTVLRVDREVLAAAGDRLDPRLKESFAEAIARRRAVCEALERDVEQAKVELAPGARVGVRHIPVERVGLYVPGGLAPLASSVIMNAVPAQVAGVGSIAVASPPQREYDGLPHPNILALCSLLGVDEVYAVGGAQAIAMFAYGAPGLCDPVSLVTGPGNIYVAAAKRVVRGVVGIDSEAGPTEIAIIADDTANAAFVAADLVSQAEHDPLAASVLITDSRSLADAVQGEIARQVHATRHEDRVRTALTGAQSGIVLVRDLDQAVAVADAYAAEHLEIHTRDAARVAAQIRNAGAIFIGGYAPVTLGDYTAGSTHVLPTGGCACHSSGLSVRSFVKTVHTIDYTREALLGVADSVERFALAEDLPGHAAAIAVRRAQ